MGKDGVAIDGSYTVGKKIQVVFAEVPSLFQSNEQIQRRTAFFQSWLGNDIFTHKLQIFQVLSTQLVADTIESSPKAQFLLHRSG